MALYEVHARKWENGWELRIEGLALTWSPTLADAEARAREHICTTLQVEESAVHIDLLPRVSDELDQLALETKRAVHNADEAMRGAAAKTREAVVNLAEAGLTNGDIARFLGLSQRRLNQLAEQSTVHP